MPGLSQSRREALAAALAMIFASVHSTTEVISLQSPESHQNTAEIFVLEDFAADPLAKEVQRRRTLESPLKVHTVVDHSTGTAGGKGLNNQLWVVAGAIEAGCKHSARPDGSVSAVILPKMVGDVEKVVGKDSSVMNMHEMGTLFDMERLSATILEDLHCLVADKPAFEGMVRDEKVVLMDEHVRRENPKYLRVKEGRAIDVLYKGMRLSEELSTLYLEPCLAKISQALGGAESYLTIHMRVEDDFTESCHFPPSKRSKKPVPRPCMYSAKRIADAVRLTRELRDYRHVFMIYAADRLNQKHAVKVYGKQPDPTEVWPAGVVATHPGHLHCFDNATLTYTERSVVNMFLAAASPGPFLGTPFSSLGMGVSLLRYHQGAVSYLYNCQSAKFRSAALYKRDAKNPSTGQIRC